MLNKLSFDYSKYASNPGNRVQPLYKRAYNNELKKEVVIHDGDTDVYEAIQEANNTSDINVLKRMINGGLTEVPDDPMALYGQDLGNYPSDIHDVFQKTSHAREAFDSLPDSVKSIFGTPDEFTKALLDGSYTSKVNNGLENYYKKQAEEAAKAAAAAQEGGKE